MGVRAPVWVALFASAAFFAAALTWGGDDASSGPERTGREARMRASRPATVAPALAPAPARREPREPRATRRVVSAAARPPETASRRIAPPPADVRSGELVGLEREAAELAASEGLVDLAALDAAVAALEPAPGESPTDFARRADALRESLASSELLVQHRLSELFESTVYPHGFPVEQVVVPQERQLIGSLPQEERAALLRGILEQWEPAPAQPRFEPPESGRVWRGGTPAL